MILSFLFDNFLNLSIILFHEKRKKSMSNTSYEYSKRIATYDYYEDTYGRIFNIKNIEYPHNGKPCYFGKIITSTKDFQIDSFSEDPSGVTIYQDEQNPNIGYRIYNGILWAAPTFYFIDGSGDARMIEELQKRQSTVKLTAVVAASDIFLLTI